MHTYEISKELASQLLGQAPRSLVFPAQCGGEEEGVSSTISGCLMHFSLFALLDDAAVGALTKYYSKSLPKGADVLDICSSWVSHFPKDWEHGKRTG